MVGGGNAHLALVVERDVGLAAGEVAEDGVTLGKGAAARVLAAEADGDAVQEQRADSEQLSVGVADLAGLGQVSAGLELGLELGVDVEAFGHATHGGADVGQRRDRHAGVHRLKGVVAVDAGPARVARIDRGHLRLALGLGQGLVEDAHQLVDLGLGGFGGDDALGDQFLGVGREGGLLCS